jgi:hypothetical protein
VIRGIEGWRSQDPGLLVCVRLTQLFSTSVRPFKKRGLGFGFKCAPGSTAAVMLIPASVAAPLLSFALVVPVALPAMLPVALPTTVSVVLRRAPASLPLPLPLAAAAAAASGRAAVFVSPVGHSLAAAAAAAAAAALPPGKWRWRSEGVVRGAALVAHGFSP